MALKDTQKQVNDWINQYKIGYWKHYELLLWAVRVEGCFAIIKL